MKTTISIPNPLFELGEELANQLHISRSELYAKALAEYLRLYHRASITERLNEIYAQEDSATEQGLAQLQLASIAKEEW